MPQARRCFIVTAGQEGWVQRSCKRFMPSVLPLLERVTIISARARYEDKFPRRPVEWKIATFSDLLSRRRMSLIDNSLVGLDRRLQVIAIGDSPHDRSAIQYVGKRTSHLQIKSIKFLENPTMPQLQKQLKLMTGYISQLANHQEPLDLVLSPNMLR
ncbi:hypothetical protein PINS_up010029 [Pythium insidiosum]|nr:hypothetical protein PINS_up010029 [Pythium insidiosum]